MFGEDSSIFRYLKCLVNSLNGRTSNFFGGWESVLGCPDGSDRKDRDRKLVY